MLEAAEEEEEGVSPRSSVSIPSTAAAPPSSACVRRARDAAAEVLERRRPAKRARRPVDAVQARGCEAAEEERRQDAAAYRIGEDVWCLALSFLGLNDMRAVHRASAFFRRLSSRPDAWGTAVSLRRRDWGEHRLNCDRLDSLPRVRARSLHTVTLGPGPWADDSWAVPLLRGQGRLRVLHLGECYDVTDASGETLARDCRRLEWLSLSNCRQLTDATARGLASLRQLRHLDLSGLRRLTGTALGSLARCRRLRTLLLGGVVGVDDRVLAKVAKACKVLSRLEISHAPHVTGAGAAAVGACCRRLTSLRLGACHGLADDDFAGLVRSLPRLITLHVDGSLHAGPALLAAVAAQRGGSAVSYLNVSMCPLVTAADVARARRACGTTVVSSVG